MACTEKCSGSTRRVINPTNHRSQPHIINARHRSAKTHQCAHRRPRPTVPHHAHHLQYPRRMPRPADCDGAMWGQNSEFAGPPKTALAVKYFGRPFACTQVTQSFCAQVAPSFRRAWLHPHKWRLAVGSVRAGVSEAVASMGRRGPRPRADGDAFTVFSITISISRVGGRAGVWARRRLSLSCETCPRVTSRESPRTRNRCGLRAIVRTRASHPRDAGARAPQRNTSK